MNGDYYKWRKIKSKDISRIENMLLDVESDYVSACARFLARVESRDSIWLLGGKKNEISALVINSRSAFLPVFRGNKEIGDLKSLKGLLRKKEIHSVQGLKDEVIILEDVLNQNGAKISETNDYDLMLLDKQPRRGKSRPSNLALRVPRMIDLDELAPLQAAYEKEEVLPAGSVFSPAASRVNIANIIANGRLLAARLDGRLVGKINVNAVSFTRYQVGGVYVHPDFRGMGIARCMAEEFISSLVSDGRGVTLFVKKNNVAARRLYLGLGFTVTGDYRITYY
jgi:hypothetical protein